MPPQVGQLRGAVIPTGNVNVNVLYTQNPGGFSSTVRYAGTVNSYLGAFFGFPSYSIGGSASAVISNSYVEVVMLLDNSSSMLIGATTADIVALEQATPCSAQAAGANQGMSAYSWTYTNNFGYNNGNTAPPITGTNGACYSSYTGAAAACFYVPTAIASQLTPSGKCKTGGDASHTPQAPCAFACHVSSTNNDYYGLARS